MDELIKTDREAFRAQATDALRQFTPDDRETAASIETGTVTTSMVLRAWAEQIEPIYQDLDEKRHDVNFKKYLIRNVGFHDEEADYVIDYMILERKQTLLDEVLDNIYPSSDQDPPYQREYAANLLSQSSVDINDFMTRYINFIEAFDAAEKQSVTLCDPHASWLDRQRSALQVYKERQRISQDESSRLDEIEVELENLVNNPDSLLKDIIEKKWNFITVLDLRAKYQKQVDALTKAEQKTPTKRLKLFERVTQSFRDREAEQLAHIHHSQSLKALRHINEEVYNLLLDIFDLNNTDRNHLLLDIQQHTRLTQERDMILLIQRNREHFLSKRQ